MSEPIKLVRGDEILIVHAPRYAAQLMAEQGWQLDGQPQAVIIPPYEPEPEKEKPKKAKK